VSVVSSIPYLSPRALNSAFPSKQSLTDWGISSPNFFIKSIKLIRSLTDPLAAFSRTTPMKSTIFFAVASSMHGTIVVGSGSLFCSNKPFKACWRISLLVIWGRAAFLNILERPNMLCPYVPASKPVCLYLPAFHSSLRFPNHLWTVK
jgi:hypothetical protein